MGSFHTRGGGGGGGGGGGAPGVASISQDEISPGESLDLVLRSGAQARYKTTSRCYQPWCGLQQPSLLFYDGWLSFLAEYSIHSRLCKSKYEGGRTGRCWTQSAAACMRQSILLQFVLIYQGGPLGGFNTLRCSEQSAHRCKCSCLFQNIQNIFNFAVLYDPCSILRRLSV